MVRRPRKAEDLRYGERKIPRQFSLTPFVDNLLETTSLSLGISRSEVIEQAFRSGAVNLVEDSSGAKKQLLMPLLRGSSA